MTPENTNHRKQAVGERHSAIGVALVGGEDTERETLHKVLNEINELPLSVSEVAAPPLSQSPEAINAQLLMVLLGSDSEKWADEIHSWFDGTVRPLVIGLAPIRTSEAVRTALRAGAEEVIFLPADRDELARCLVKISETHKDISDGHRSLTCSLVSVAGGTGVSTLTAGLAFAIRRLTQKQVGMLDLGLQCSALSAVLDLEPTHTITELVDQGCEIDSIRLESVLTRHDSGLCLLAAPGRIEEAELISPVTVGSTLDVMRELFDFIMVDCGHYLTEGTVAAWRHSDFVLYVLEQSVTSVRPAQRFLDLFDRLRLKGVRLEFVLNRFDPKHPITVQQIETALRRPVYTRIPRDDQAFVRAQISGDDIAAIAPSSEASVSTEGLARRLFGLPVLTRGERGLFSRLFATTND